MPQYITIPTSLTGPADGAKVDLSAACEWHRDDSAVPNVLTVDNGEYRVFRLSDPTTETAAPSIINPATLYTAGRAGFMVAPSATTSFTSADNSVPAGNGDLVQYQLDDSGSARHLSMPSSGFRPNLVVAGSQTHLNFPSGKNMLSAPSAVWADATNGVSFVARFRLSATGADQVILGKNSTTALGRLFALTFRTATGQLEAQGFTGATLTNTANITTSGGSISASVWYTACVVFTPSAITLYIDDMATAVATTANGAGTVKALAAPIHLGSRAEEQSNVTDYLNGDIAFAAVGNWNWSQSDRETFAAYAADLT